MKKIEKKNKLVILKTLWNLFNKLDHELRKIRKNSTCPNEELNKIIKSTKTCRNTIIKIHNELKRRNCISEQTIDDPLQLIANHFSFLKEKIKNKDFHELYESCYVYTITQLLPPPDEGADLTDAKSIYNKTKRNFKKP